MKVRGLKPGWGGGRGGQRRLAEESTHHETPTFLFSRNYKYKPRVRLFAEDAAGAAAKFTKKTPLAGLHFMLDGGPFHNGQSQRDVAAVIKKLGGSLITTVSCCRVVYMLRSTFETKGFNCQKTWYKNPVLSLS